MKLLEILRNRVSDSRFDAKICGWLYNRAEDIIRKTSAHLEYVRNVLDEFDKHSAEHSKRVLEIIEDLLGDRAENLSSYDLFSLIAVAYLHDCGMAISDYEVRVMNLVENGDYDGKKVFDTEEALEIIKGNINKIFETDRDAEDIKKWLFYPGSEQKLFEYYALLMIDYQTFRNGKIDVIRKSEDLNKTNKELRLELIRRTHADRVETYIGTWGEKEIADFNGNQPEGEQLFNNIAMACKAHGKDVNYIKKELDKKVGYLGSETSNLRFVAMMLRIGDIVHFTYDRAPIVLRALHHFESTESYEQWRIKADSGVNFDVTNGAIICKAYCKNPKDYYNLSSYVGYVNYELQLYNRLKFEEDWDASYPIMTKSVDSENLNYNKKLFTPVPNLKFTLEQNRILDLLMGAELYSDEYACLRELYQNSLDACRCQLARGQSKGNIEFGLKTDKKNGNRYVYCLDNGKGMSTHIIENYLLKIGSSFYKSAEFYQSQAETGNTFTPTSQFGIGILSCFMIGDKLEITTRELGGDYISCVIENIHECFYYKPTSQEDKDDIKYSGTLIKIFLNEKYKDKMSNEYLENIGYLLWKKEESYNKEDKKHSDHLYIILDGFVKIVPNNIELKVKMSNGKALQVYNKPLPMGEGICMFPKDKDNILNNERIEKIEYLDLDVENDGIRYRTYLVLPTEKAPSYFAFGGDVSFGRNSYCVDGIKVDDDFEKGDFMARTNGYHVGGVISFMGSERPQLSISREKIVNFEQKKYEKKIEELLSKLIKQAIEETVSYILKHHVRPETVFYYGIWNAFFKRFEDVGPNMIIEHFKEETIKDLIIPLPKGFTSSQMTFGDFMGDNVCFKDYRFFQFEDFLDCSKQMKSIIVNRIGYSQSISWDGTNVTIKRFQPNNTSGNYYVPIKGGLFNDYDIVSSLYPFISDSMDKLDEDLRGLFEFVDLIYRVIMRSPNSPEIERICDLLGEEIYMKEKGLYGMHPRDYHLYSDVYSFLSEFFNKNRMLLLAGLTRRLRYSLRIVGDTVITMYAPIPTELIRHSHTHIFPMYDSADGNGREKGLSIVLFGGEDFYVVPGCHSRQELVKKVPDDVWNGLRRREYYFTDGTVVRSRQNNWD